MEQADASRCSPPLDENAFERAFDLVYGKPRPDPSEREKFDRRMAKDRYSDLVERYLWLTGSGSHS